MKLHQIRDFIAVADKGSVRAAARSLGLAQSATSRSVTQLERELGAVLFERRKRGTVLTPMGTLFLRRARTVASELRHAQQELHQHQGGVEGSVVACLATTPHIDLLPGALPLFRERFPGVRLHIMEGVVYGAIEPKLRDGTIDFYIGLTPQEKPALDLSMEKLFDNPRVVLGRKGHPLSGAKSLAELVGAEWVISGRDRAEAELIALFRRNQLPPPTRVWIGDSALTLMVLLAHTDSLAIVPRQWTQFAPTRAVLEKIDISEDLHTAANVLIRRSDIPLTPAAQFLCDSLRRTDAGPPERSARKAVSRKGKHK